MTNYRERIYSRYATSFQGAGPVFDELTALQWQKWYGWYLRGLLPDRKDAAILDVGCGSGMLLHFFKLRGYTKVKGVDWSQEQVALAKQVIDDVAHENALDYLESHLGEFDLIVGLDILEHFHKDEVVRFLDGCFSALLPGGRLILQTPNGESPWGGSIQYGDFTHEVCLTPTCLQKLMGLCGYSDVRVFEAGPVPHGLMSSLRYMLWRLIHLGWSLYNVVEKGNNGSGIFTRVFIGTGIVKRG